MTSVKTRLNKTLKTRLNKTLRAHLLKLAVERVHDTETKAALDAAFTTCEAMLRRLIEEQYPAADMAVMQKYQVAAKFYWIDMMIVDGDNPVRYGNWSFPHETDEQKAALPVLPQSPYGQKRLRISKADDVATYNTWASAGAAHEKARSDKLEVFRQLILNAKNLEQVEEVWPAAKSVRGYVTNLPTVALAPLMDQVRAIVEARQA